jgi:hypothetical protein
MSEWTKGTKAGDKSIKIVSGDAGFDPKEIDFRVKSKAEASALMTAVLEARAVLAAYEQWEADLIMSSEAWEGFAALPTIPQDLWDRLIEIQGMRNKVLRKSTT